MKKNYNSYATRREPSRLTLDAEVNDKEIENKVEAPVEEKVVDVKKVKVINCSNLNVRASNSMSAKVLTVLTAGTIVEKVDSKNGWFKIIHEGVIGWSLGQYFEEV